MKRIDSSTLDILEEDAKELKEIEVGEVIVQTENRIAIDQFKILQKTGRFVIIDEYEVCGGGIIINPLNLLDIDD